MSTGFVATYDTCQIQVAVCKAGAQAFASVVGECVMSIRNFASLAFALFAFTLSPASAYESGSKIDGYPIYVGFALGFSAADSDCDYHGYDCDGNDTSFKIYAGKRLHENLALEISYQELGKLNDETINATTTADSAGINISLLGIIPVGDSGFFYGKIGAIATQTDYTRIDGSITRSDDDDTGLTYGVGYAFLFDEKYDLRIEFERLNELNNDFTPGGAYITVLSFGGTIYFR